MNGFRAIILGFSLLALAACTSAYKVEVTRFHGLAAGGGQTFRVVPAEGVADDLEFKSYAGIVANRLEAAGFKLVFTGEPDLVAAVQYGATPDPAYRSGGGFSIGLGAGSFGRNVGGGVGASVPVTGGNAEYYLQSLTLALKLASTGVSVFEGRALAHDKNPNAVLAVTKLAEALFTDFPGRSGETITVTLKTE